MVWFPRLDSLATLRKSSLILHYNTAYTYYKLPFVEEALYVYNIVHQRINHKLNEWSGKDNANLTNFIAWAHSLPYANELIFIEGHNDQKEVERTSFENIIGILSKIGIKVKNTDGTLRTVPEILEDVADVYTKTSQAHTDEDTSYKN